MPHFHSGAKLRPVTQLFRPIPLLFLLSTAAIIYGSLFPFILLPGGPDAEAISTFLRSWAVLPSRGDVMGNIALFVPFGLLGALIGAPHPPSGARLVALLLGGIILGLLVQVGQLWLWLRDASLADVMWNGVGLVLGLAVASVPKLRRIAFHLGQGGWPGPAWMLLGLFALLHLSPLIPSLDYENLKASLKPLLLNPQFTFRGFVLAVASWLVVLCLVAQLRPLRETLVWAGLLLTALQIGKLLSLFTYVTAQDMAGALFAGLLWHFWFSHSPARQRFAALFALMALIYASLEPFDLRGSPAKFYSLPFAGALMGDMKANITNMAQKLFLFGGALWLLMPSQRYGLMVVGVALLALCLELGQIWIGHGTPESTEALLVLLMGLVFAVFARQTPTDRAAVARDRSFNALEG